MVRKNAIEIYSAHKEGTSVVAKRFIQILKNKIYKYMTSISKNIYIDELDDIANKGNNIYHRTIKMKPVDAKSNKYINSSREINDKDPRFKIGDIVRILKYQKKKFPKGYIPNWSEDVFVITNVRNIVPWAYVLSDFKGEEIV